MCRTYAIVGMRVGIWFYHDAILIGIDYTFVNLYKQEKAPLRKPFQLTMKTLNLGLERPRSLIYIALLCKTVIDSRCNLMQI